MMGDGTEYSVQHHCSESTMNCLVKMLSEMGEKGMLVGMDGVYDSRMIGKVKVDGLDD